MPAVETTRTALPVLPRRPAPRRLSVWRMSWTGPEKAGHLVDRLIINRSIPAFGDAGGVKTINDVGTWRLRYPIFNEDDIPNDGDYFLFTLGNETIESGPFTSCRVNYSSLSGALECHLAGIGEEYVLRDRLVYPDAHRVPEQQSVSSHDSRSGLASTVMIGYVEANVNVDYGPASNMYRGYGAITMAPDPMLGPTIPMRERWSGLLDTLQRAAYKSGLAFRVVRSVGGPPEFQVYQPRDRSHIAVFDYRRGNVSDMEWSREAPTVTRVIAGGQGELTERMIAENVDYDAAARWRRSIEKFRDQRSESSIDQLRSDNVATIGEGVAKETIKVTTTDSPLGAYGDAWRLGDRVRARILSPSGAVLREVVDNVQQIEWSATPSGAILRPVIGTDGSADLAGAAQKQLAARMSQVEGAQ